MKSILIDHLEKFELAHLNIIEILSQALQSGGDFAELFFEKTEFTRVVYEGKKIDRLLDGTDEGVGLRVIYSGRSVYAYTSDLSQESLIQLAQSLSQVILTQSPSSTKKKFSIPQDWKEPKGIDSKIKHYEIKNSPRKASLKEKVEMAQKVEQGALDELPNARQVTSAVMDTLRKILIVNSDGLCTSDSKTYLQSFCEVVGAEGKRVETAYESKGGFVGLDFFDTLSFESIGQSAAKRVKILLSALPAPSGTMPVVISSEAGGTMIHEAVGHGLEADLAFNGLSVYQNKLGQQVASPLISVLDDGTMIEKRGSYRVDDEGNPSHSTVLIENGELKNYLVDRLSAMKFDLVTTGNGRRESFRHQPIVRMTNTYIAPGKDDPAQILKDTKWGIFVKSMDGGQVSTVTGDFVFAVTEGYLIRDGQCAEAIRGATLVGNGPKVLLSVDRVGNDLGFSTGTCGKDGQGAPVTDAQPTLRIPELTVGGEVPISNYWKN